MPIRIIDRNHRGRIFNDLSIESFRNLNQEIETIINKSEAVRKARKDYQATFANEPAGASDAGA
jgi:hypothetical protein